MAMKRGRPGSQLGSQGQERRTRLPQRALPQPVQRAWPGLRVRERDGQDDRVAQCDHRRSGHRPRPQLRQVLGREASRAAISTDSARRQSRVPRTSVCCRAVLACRRPERPYSIRASPLRRFEESQIEVYWTFLLRRSLRQSERHSPAPNSGFRRRRVRSWSCRRPASGHLVGSSRIAVRSSASRAVQLASSRLPQTRRLKSIPRWATLF